MTRRDLDTDDDGNIDRTEVDRDADGTYERTLHYDADGTVTGRDWDCNDDGTIDRTEAYTYDASGNLLRTMVDRDGNGTTDRIETYLHDEMGNRIQTRIDHYFSGDDTPYQTDYYDANGNLTRTDYDWDADGTIDQTATDTYDANGNRVRTDYDYADAYAYAGDAFGVTVLSCVETSYASGNMIWTQCNYDTDGDGIIDWVVYSYDTNYFQDDYDYDNDNDGTIDKIYHHDANGNLTRTEVDDDGDGIIDWIDTWYPENATDRYRRDEDTDNDGDLDQVEYAGDFDYSEDFPKNRGLEVVLLGGVGEGVTDLTIPDGFVFAGNTAPDAPVRIEGSGVDKLRFDMDDFTEGDRTDFGGDEYRSFTADDGTWSFIVDADVMLFDL